jgi:hypothetical protein
MSETPVQQWTRTHGVAREVHWERKRQDAKWGEQNHPLSQGSDDRAGCKAAERYWQKENAARVQAGELTWDGILLEEVYEALAESDPKAMRAELLQVAAVAVAMVEYIDRENA